jgi:hypothetical protein
LGKIEPELGTSTEGAPTVRVLVVRLSTRSARPHRLLGRACPWASDLEVEVLLEGLKEVHVVAVARALLQELNFCFGPARLGRLLAHGPEDALGCGIRNGNGGLLHARGITRAG